MSMFVKHLDCDRFPFRRENWFFVLKLFFKLRLHLIAWETVTQAGKNPKFCCCHISRRRNYFPSRDEILILEFPSARATRLASRCGKKSVREAVKKSQVTSNKCMIIKSCRFRRWNFHYTRQVTTALRGKMRNYLRLALRARSSGQKKIARKNDLMLYLIISPLTLGQA